MKARQSNLAPPASALAFLCVIAATGCQNRLHKIDKRVDTMVLGTSAMLGPDAYPPRTTVPDSSVRITKHSPAASEQPSTVNPPAAELSYQVIEQADEVLSRLNAYSELPADALAIDLPFSLAYAAKHAREYQFADTDGRSLPLTSPSAQSCDRCQSEPSRP
jgi:hypothetical protein